jgi:hypothetical protein
MKTALCKGQTGSIRNYTAGGSDAPGITASSTATVCNGPIVNIVNPVF